MLGRITLIVMDGYTGSCYKISLNKQRMGYDPRATKMDGNALSNKDT